ncbi:MAG TPA: thioredoxin family protein [Candidatus Dormibacteraeota bacterium]|nr:thioredoxin family protein [Candidatus Dormibacteraeota bacterium]
MKTVTNELLNNEDYLLYIHTPFCGTCHLAKTILTQIESAHQQDLFYEMNASLFPDFMQEMEIKSVPCLLIKKAGEIKETIYVFHSVPNIYHYLLKYHAEMFLHHKKE